ncbi:hypothetical protein ACLKA6_010605 [Drosophila palustris]
MPTNTSPKRRLSKAFTASIGSGVGNGVGVFELLVRQQCNNNTNNSNGNNNTKLLLEDLQALHSFLAHRSKRKCRTAGVGIGCKPGAKRAGFCPPSSTASTFTADCDEEKDEDDQSIAVEQHRWLGHLLGALERFACAATAAVATKLAKSGAINRLAQRLPEMKTKMEMEMETGTETERLRLISVNTVCACSSSSSGSQTGDQVARCQLQLWPWHHRHRHQHRHLNIM